MKARDLYTAVKILWPAWQAEPESWCAMWESEVANLADRTGIAALKAHARVSQWPPSLAEFLHHARVQAPASGGPACQRCHKRLPESGRCDCPEPVPGASGNGWKLDGSPQAGWPPRPVSVQDEATVRRLGVADPSALPLDRGDGAAPRIAPNSA